MTSFSIKIIACVAMLLDHIKYAIPETQNFATLYLGRIAFPLFAFLITQGYIHTSNLNKYFERLAIFAIISQIPFMLFRLLVGEWIMLNIMFTLMLGLMAITVIDKIEKRWLSIPICVLIMCVAELLNVDYGWFGVATVILIYCLRNKKSLLPLSFGMLVLVNFWYDKILIFNETILGYFIGYLISTIFMIMYNGKQGRKMKYFFYCFYPVHMIILFLISNL